MSLKNSSKKSTSKGWRDKHFKNDGNGHIRGYAGLTHTAKPISEYIPKVDVYVEPFAGLGRVAKYVHAKEIILNDLSDFAVDECRKRFPKAVITKLDFRDCIKQFDGKNVFMLKDPPWSFSEYENGCLNRAVCTMKPREYYEILLDMVKSLKCDWFICGNKKNSQMENTDYSKKTIYARQKIMGGRIATKLISNKKFVRCWQNSLVDFV